MSTDIKTIHADDVTNPKWMTWAGRVLSGLLAALLVFSAVMKFSAQPLRAESALSDSTEADASDDAESPVEEANDVAKEFVRLGYPQNTTRGIAIAELASTILYVVPQTAVLGAILLTGYLGGATATHVRIGDPFIGPLIIGVLIWLGIFLRDARLRQLIPLRR